MQTRGIETATSIQSHIFEEAGHILFAAEVADLDERYHLGLIGSGALIQSVVDRYHDQGHIREIMAYLVGRLEQAWGERLFWVYHRVIQESDMSLTDFLFSTLMACQGYGLHPFDEHGFRERWEAELDTDPAAIHIEAPFDEAAHDYIFNQINIATEIDEEPWIVPTEGVGA